MIITPSLVTKQSGKETRPGNLRNSVYIFMNPRSASHREFTDQLNIKAKGLTLQFPISSGNTNQED